MCSARKQHRQSPPPPLLHLRGRADAAAQFWCAPPPLLHRTPRRHPLLSSTDAPRASAARLRSAARCRRPGRRVARPHCCKHRRGSSQVPSALAQSRRRVHATPAASVSQKSAPRRRSATRDARSVSCSSRQCARRLTSSASCEHCFHVERRSRAHASHVTARATKCSQPRRALSGRSRENRTAPRSHVGRSRWFTRRPSSAQRGRARPPAAPPSAAFGGLAGASWSEPHRVCSPRAARNPLARAAALPAPPHLTRSRVACNRRRALLLCDASPRRGLRHRPSRRRLSAIPPDAYHASAPPGALLVCLLHMRLPNQQSGPGTSAPRCRLCETRRRSSEVHVAVGPSYFR